MPKILLIDDPELIGCMRRSAAERSGCRILCAPTAEALLERAVAERPDAVVLRRASGDGEGQRAIELLRAEPAAAGIPVVVLDELPVDPGALATRLGLDCRAGGRRAVALPVRWHLGARSGTARTKDVSAEGLFLKTREPFERHQAVPLIFRLPDRDETIRAEGEVVRVVPYDRDSHLIPGVALRIRRIGDRDRAELARFVERGREERP